MARRAPRHASLLLLAFAGACSEYGVERLPPEPDACDVPMTETVSVPVAGCRAEVELAPVEDPWAVRTLWTWPAPEDGLGTVGSISTPIVGLLSDDNGDGVVDERDGSVVVVSVYEPDRSSGLALIDGASGRTRWLRSDLGALQPALADVDADGFPEILALDHAHMQVVAVSALGETLWVSDLATYPIGLRGASAADLDGDGRPEVLADGAFVLDGEDGTLAAALISTLQPGVTAADLDLDGRQEVLALGAVYSAEGAERWRSPQRPYFYAFPMVLQADEDPQAEVFWLDWESFTLSEHTGDLVLSVDTNPSDANPWIGGPCAGDFDGDGAPELGLPMHYRFAVHGLDGDERWRVELPGEYSYGRTCAGFDFDADGDIEPILASDTRLRVFDGATGATLYEDTTHRSVGGGGSGSPVVADVDADGHAELLVTGSTDAPAALRVLEHDGAGWPPAGRSWGAWDFAVTNANPTGHVPRSPEPSWLAFNTWRARPAAEGKALADLVVAAASACAEPGRVAVSVANQGIADVPAGALLLAYDGEDEVARVELPALRRSTRRDGIVLDVGGPADGLRFEVDAHGLAEECDTGNNVRTSGP